MSLRFSLLGLIALVTFAAVACETLLHPGSWWTSAVISLTACVISLQLLRAVLLSGEPRAGAIGWLLFVLGYLAVTTGPWLSGSFGRQMLTSRGLEYVQVQWRKESPQEVPVSHFQQINLNTGQISLYDGTSSTIWIDSSPWGIPTATNTVTAPVNVFQLSGHWLLAWVAGWIGAAVATCLHRRKAAGTTGKADVAVGRAANHSC